MLVWDDASLNRIIENYSKEIEIILLKIDYWVNETDFSEIKEEAMNIQKCCTQALEMLQKYEKYVSTEKYSKYTSSFSHTKYLKNLDSKYYGFINCLQSVISEEEFFKNCKNTNHEIVEISSEPNLYDKVDDIGEYQHELNILGLDLIDPSKLTIKTVRAAFRKHIKIYHPDPKNFLSDSDNALPDIANSIIRAYKKLSLLFEKKDVGNISDKKYALPEIGQKNDG